jgi:glycosyltransferase involved in cell wall biosynthesis
MKATAKKASGKVRLLILNSPIFSANEKIFLDKHIRTLRRVCDKIVVVTGNYPVVDTGIQIIQIKNGLSREFLANRALNTLIVQIKLTYYLMRCCKTIDVVFFDIGEYRNTLPLIISKILRKRSIVIHQGGNKLLESRIENTKGWTKLIPPFQNALLKICYSLVNCIVCISPSIVRFGKLEKYSKKISFWGGDYIDIDRFLIESLPSERKDVIGFAGRLSPKKGVINLVKAIPFVNKELPNVRFFIAGSGEQKALIDKEISKIMPNNITVFPWLSDDDFPKYLRQLKLFVLPSVEEGVPAVLREAMACGTIVLSTPVGGIPDIVNEGQTGFVLTDNNPQAIAKKIVEVLKRPDLDKIALNSRSLVKAQSSLEASIRNWKAILSMMNKRGRA